MLPRSFVPTAWDEVVGQPHILAVLQSPLLPSTGALVLTGPPNTGKSTLARLFRLTRPEGAWAVFEARDIADIPDEVRAHSLHLRTRPLSAEAIFERLHRIATGAPADEYTSPDPILTEMARRARGDITEALTALLGFQSTEDYQAAYGPDLAPTLAALLTAGRIPEALQAVQAQERFGTAQELLDSLIDHLAARLHTEGPTSHRALAHAMSACLDLYVALGSAATLAPHTALAVTVARLAPAFTQLRPQGPPQAVESPSAEPSTLTTSDAAVIQQQLADMHRAALDRSHDEVTAILSGRTINGPNAI